MTTSRCLRRCLIGEAQAGQVQDEREGRRADAQVADELASVASVGHVISPEGGWRKQAAVVAVSSDSRILTVYDFAPRGVKADVAMISTISLRILNSLAAKNRRRSGSVLRAEGADRLLDQVVEQLLDERRVCVSSLSARNAASSPDAVELDAFRPSRVS